MACRGRSRLRIPCRSHRNTRGSDDLRSRVLRARRCGGRLSAGDGRERRRRMGHCLDLIVSLIATSFSWAKSPESRLTTTGTNPPVCTWNFLCPIARKKALMTPECAVMDTKVEGSVAKISFSASLARTASCVSVSSYTGSQRGSCSVNEGSKSNPAECQLIPLLTQLQPVKSSWMRPSLLRLTIRLRNQALVTPLVARVQPNRLTPHLLDLAVSSLSLHQLTTGRTPLSSTMSRHVISSVLALRRMGDE